jgi:hypothetical protein
MRRRARIIWIATILVAGALPAFAQEPGKLYRLGSG